MIATIKGRKSLDIPATLEEYSNMAGNMPSDYVLSGCDTTLGVVLCLCCTLGVVVQWLDYLAVTQEPGVRFPATAHVEVPSHVALP